MFLVPFIIWKVVDALLRSSVNISRDNFKESMNVSGLCCLCQKLVLYGVLASDVCSTVSEDVSK